jgi:hypothetical protein
LNSADSILSLDSLPLTVALLDSISLLWPWLRQANRSDDFLSFHFNIWGKLSKPALHFPLIVPFLHFLLNVAEQELHNELLIKKIARDAAAIFFRLDGDTPELRAFLPLMDLLIEANWSVCSPVFRVNLAILCHKIGSYSIETSIEVLKLYEKMTLRCGPVDMANRSRHLDIGVILRFIDSSDRRLAHSAIIALSVMIRASVVDSSPLIGSPLVLSLVEKLSDADYEERKMSVQLIEAILIDHDWRAFPVGTFRPFMTAAVDFLGNSTRETESVLIGLLVAMDTPNPEFQREACGICEELGIFEEIAPLSMAGGRVGSLATQIMIRQRGATTPTF